MKYLGLDVGEKRIGVALSDGLMITAQGLKTIHYDDLTSALLEIRSIINDKNVTRVVVGLPKNMNGSVGFQGERVISFVEELKKHITQDVVMWDERLSSRFAERTLISANVKRKARKQVIDKIAATSILQNYMDSQKPVDM